MRTFLQKTIGILILVYIVNLGIGFLIEKDNQAKSELGIYYPPKRWKDFYLQSNNSIEALFLGSSLCYRGYNPLIFEQKTGMNSFNMGSSMQTVSSSFFILNEVLKSQNPKVIFFELSPRSLTIDNQLEGVRYNLNYMKNWESKWSYFKGGLTFKEKIAYLFPAYYNRDQLNRIVKFSFKEIDTSKLDELYFYKGFVKSSETIDLEELQSDKWTSRMKFEESENFVMQMDYLRLIVELCKKNRIKLFLLNTPLPMEIYKKLNIAAFESLITSLADENDISYINLNVIRPPLVDTVHFKDHHLNYNGARINTEFLGKYYNRIR